MPLHIIITIVAQEKCVCMCAWARVWVWEKERCAFDSVVGRQVGHRLEIRWSKPRCVKLSRTQVCNKHPGVFYHADLGEGISTVSHFLYYLYIFKLLDYLIHYLNTIYRNTHSHTHTYIHMCIYTYIYILYMYIYLHSYGSGNA